MRNTWLVIKREYTERVRTRAFIIFTLLMPAIVGGIVILPAKLASMKTAGQHHIVVVTSDSGLGEAVRQQLTKKDEPAKQAELGDRQEPTGNYAVEVNTSPTDETRKRLTAQVSDGKLDGYVWLSDEALKARKFNYLTKNSSDFIESSTVRRAVSAAITQQKLAARGIAGEELKDILADIDMDTVRIEKGQESKASSMAAFFLPFALMMLIYMTVIIYGVSVMRSVLEEKTNRVVEVLLSSIRAKELMAGKILGVGAVGLTQMLIWATMGVVASLPTVVAARPYLAEINIPIVVYIFFPVFFLLGYVLYSTMYAAIGSMVNSDEEAQQMQWPVLMPLILCTVFAMAVIRQPNSSLAFWASMFPLTSPIVMFVRIVSQTPPMWQIALSIFILLATIYGLVALCSRIFRVGILMYGKRPTLPELMKWVKYSS